MPRRMDPGDETRRIRDAQNGDTRAFEDLMRAYEPVIYGVALRMSGNVEDAQDMMQETMLRIYRHLEGFKGNSKFSTWVYRITTNVCLDAFRKSRQEQSIESLSEAGMQFEGSPDALPEIRQERSELMQSIQEAIRTLPNDLRMAVVLRDIQGFSYDEIAGITGATPGTVKSRISRARGRLREKLHRSGDIDSYVIGGKA